MEPWLGGAFALLGVAVGFTLQEISTRSRLRESGRSALHGTWSQVADAELLLRHFKETGQLPLPSSVELNLSRFQQEFSEIRRVSSYHGMNGISRLLSGYKFVEADLRLLAQVQISDASVDKAHRETLVNRTHRFHDDLLQVGQYMDARLRLTLGLWARSPRSAARMRSVIVRFEESERSRMRTVTGQK